MAPRSSTPASSGEHRTSKRYVLLAWENELTDERLRELQTKLESRYGKLRLIAVKGNPRAVIVKTTNEVAPLLRDPDAPLLLGGKKVESVLTSGAVGNLKRRALGTTADGQILE